MKASRFILAACTIAVATVSGCAPTREQIDARLAVDAYLGGNFDRAVRTLEPLSEKQDEDYVLNNLRLGAAALASYDFDTAENAYVRAYQILNATRVNDAAREARTVWLGESNKVWRGEPYERAVANFQLGMIYYQRGDWNNARGAFENALFKLRDYADPKSDDYDEQESDFAIASLMLGRAWMKLGNPDESRRHFDRVVAQRPELAELARALADESNNVLLYVEFGFGPRKVEDGMDGNALDFFPKPRQVGPVPPMRVAVDGRSVPLGELDRPLFDTLAMALDRRWQRLDTIRKTKSYLGTGLLAAGAGATIYGANRRDQGTAIAGLGMMAVGALLKASSAADTRTWEMTPRSGFLIPLRLRPGRRDVTVAFPGGLHQTWRGLDVPAAGEATFYFRMLRWTSGEFDWPPGARRASRRPMPRKADPVKNIVIQRSAATKDLSVSWRCIAHSHRGPSSLRSSG